MLIISANKKQKNKKQKKGVVPYYTHHLQCKKDCYIFTIQIASYWNKTTFRYFFFSSQSNYITRGVLRRWSLHEIGIIDYNTRRVSIIVPSLPLQYIIVVINKAHQITSEYCYYNVMRHRLSQFVISLP